MFEYYAVKLWKGNEPKIVLAVFGERCPKGFTYFKTFFKRLHAHAGISLTYLVQKSLA